MKPVKNGRVGWDLGNKFRVLSRKKWGSTYVYQLRFMFKKTWWIEYQEHRKMFHNKCFMYNDQGDYVGKQSAT
jgi:hypothetical protein